MEGVIKHTGQGAPPMAADAQEFFLVTFWVEQLVVRHAETVAS